MNKKVRLRYLKSRWYILLAVPALVCTGAIYLGNYLSKSKPEERFYIFMSGKAILNSNIKEKIQEKKTSKYDYLLDFNLNFQDEKNSSYGSYILTDGLKYADLIIYSASMFEETFANNFSRYFAPLDMEIIGSRYNGANYVSKDGNNYGVKIHSKGSNTKDEKIGLEFYDDDYYVSIRVDSVHKTAEDDACYTFIEAFI